MAEVMLEVRRTWAAAKKIVELLLGRGFLVARAGAISGNEPFGDSDGAAVGKVEMILMEAAFEGKAGNFRAFLAAEFFFLDGEENGLLIDQSDRGAAA